MDSTARVNVFINDDDALKKLQKLQQAYEANTKELERLTKAGKANSQQAAELKAAQDKLTHSMDDQRQKAGLAAMSYKDLKSAYRELYNEWARAVPGSDQRNKLQKELGAIQTQIDKVKLSSAKADGVFASTIKGINKYAGAILVIGKALSALGVKMPDVIGAVTEFDKTFRNVQTLMSDADKDAFSLGLKKGQIDLIRNYGAEISDVNKALFDTISAGIPAGDATKFMNDAMVLSVGGVTDLSVAVDGLTSVMNAYGISAADTERVASAFFTAQKYGKTTVAELASNIGKVAPVANSAGIGMNELMSSLAVLTTKGIKTAEATTGLKAAISGLLKPSAEAEEVLRAYGVPVGATEIQAAGLGKTLEALNGIFLQNRDDLSRAIPSVEAYNAVAALTGDTLQTYSNVLQQVNTDYGHGSSLQKAYGENMGSIEMRTKQASAELKAYILENETLKEGYLLLVKTGGGLLKFFVEYRWWLLALGVAIGTYVAKAKVLDFWNKNIVTGLTGATKGVKGFVGGLKAMGSAIMANPLGVILGAATALIPVFEKLFSRTKEYNAEAEIMARVQGKVGEKVAEEQTQIDLLRQTIEDNTISVDKRREAIQKLQGIVPDYHGALTDEGTLIDHNTDALDRYIQRLVEVATRQVYIDELTAVNKKKLDKQFEIDTKQSQYDAMAGADYDKVYRPTGSAGVRTNELTEKGLLKFEIAEDKKALAQFAKEEELLMQKIKTVTNEMGQEISANGLKTAKDVEAYYTQATDRVVQSYQTQIDAIDKELANPGPRQTDETEKLLGKRLDLIRQKNDEEVALESQKQQKLDALKNTKTTGGGAATVVEAAAQETELLAQEYARRLALLDAELASEVLSAQVAAEKKNIATHNAYVKEGIKSEGWLQRRNDTEKEYNDQVLAAQEKYQEKVAALQAETGQQVSTTYRDMTTNAIEAVQRCGIETKLTGDKAMDSMLDKQAETVREYIRNEQHKYDESKKSLKEWVAVTEATLNDIGDRLGKDNPFMESIMGSDGLMSSLLEAKDQIGSLFDAIKEGGDDMGENVGAIAAALSQMIGNIGQSLNTLLAAQTQMAMAEEEARYQKSSTQLKKHYDQQINAAAGNEEEQQRLREEYAQQKEMLDYRTEVKKLDIEKKAADAQFAINVGTATAQAALAIVQCYAQLGPIGGSIAAVMVAATTALQIMAMKAQRDAIKNKTIESPSLSGSTSVTTPSATPPAIREVTDSQSMDYVRGYEDGGYTDVSRSQDGRRYRAAVRPGQRGYIGRPTILVGEDGGEFVANAQATRNPHLRPVFDIIDAAQRRGTVARLNMGVIARSLSGARVRGYAAGGYTYDPKGAMAAVAADNGQVLAMMAQIRADIDRLNTTMGQKHKAYVVLNELNDMQQKLDDAKNFARR